MDVETLVPESRFEKFGGKIYFANELEFRNYLKELKNSKKTTQKKSGEAVPPQSRYGGYDHGFPSLLDADNG